MQRTRYIFQQQQHQQQQQQQMVSASTSAAAQVFGQPIVSSQSRRLAPVTRVSSMQEMQKPNRQQQHQQQQQPLQRSNIGLASNRASTSGLSASHAAQQQQQPQQIFAGPEFSIDLGELTQTPRRRVSAVPSSSLQIYRLLRKLLSFLACLIAVADLTLGVSDIVIGFSMATRSATWQCSGSSAGASVLASGVTGCLFCLSMVTTQWLATGNTVVHSSITSTLMLVSLSHTWTALPRMQLSYLAENCNPKAAAYLWLTSLARLFTLIAAGFYYAILNYFACRFGEDNSSSEAGASGANSVRSGGARDRK